jgi:Domain of unknown function (DUF4340)
MSDRFDNKRLLFLLVGLIAILLLTVVIKIPKEKATLKSKIVEFDTSEVNRIILYPRVSNGNAVEFNKKNNKWKVQQGSIVSATQEGVVQNIFGDVLRIKPQSLAAVNKSKWTEFEVTDSLATRIKFLDRKGKIIADLMIGKFNYRQPDNTYAGYGGNNIQVTSFVRLYSEQKVYAVDGLLPFSFNSKFDDLRDRTFVKSEMNNITSIRLVYPSDSGFSLIRKDKVWQIGDKIADSTNTANYLVSLGMLNGENFRDDFKPVVSPVYQVLIEGNNLLSITVKCFKGDGPDEFILNSSLNPDVYFATKKDGIFEKLFKPKSYFLRQAKKR